MATEFGTGKTIFILAIVVGCFAVLWPKIFYPMLQSSVTVKPNIVPTTDCCDVIYEKDLNAIKIMTQLCEKILSSHPEFDKRLLLAFQQGRITKEIVNKCNTEVHDKCNVDIKEFLSEHVRLGKTYQQMLSELRSLNSSICLKVNFGISPALLGAPRRFRVWDSKHLRQERPPHLRPHMMHPALREKGRAIPHSHVIPRVMEKDPAATPMPMPMPGMRPPMGGAGHVVPAPKGSSTMGIVMPLYTIGIVIFFMYTMMKLIFKKSDESQAYKQFQPDPEFRRVVFNDTEYSRPTSYKEIHNDENNTKLVVTAISGLVAEVNRDILSKGEPSAAEEDKAEEPVAVDEVEKAVKEEGNKIEKVEKLESAYKSDNLPVEENTKIEKLDIQEKSMLEPLDDQYKTKIDVLDDSKAEKIDLQESNIEDLDLQDISKIEKLDVKEGSKAEELILLEEPKVKELASQVSLKEEEFKKPEESTLKEVDIIDTTKEVEKPEIKSAGAIQVVGMEMTESLEGGQKWSRPPTPLSPRSVTPTIPPPEPENIYLEGSLSSQSQLLVSQSEVEKLPVEGEESPVILAGKVTLSLIGFDDKLKTDNGGLIISTLSSDEASDEEEEEEEGIIEQVSEDEAEEIENLELNHDEDLTTNYTTASGAGVLGDETAAEVSAMEPQHDDEEEEEEDEDLEEDVEPQPKVASVTTLAPTNAFEEDEDEEEVEEEDEEEEEIEEEAKPLPKLPAVSNASPLKETKDDEEEEEEEEEEVEEEEVAEEELEEVGRPQSLQHQHER